MIQFPPLPHYHHLHPQPCRREPKSWPRKIVICLVGLSQMYTNEFDASKTQSYMNRVTVNDDWVTNIFKLMIVHYFVNKWNKTLQHASNEIFCCGWM